MILGTAAYMSPEQAKGQDAWTNGATSGRSAACSTRCSPAGARSRARTSGHARRVLRANPTGRRCPRSVPAAIRGAAPTLPREGPRTARCATSRRALRARAKRQRLGGRSKVRLKAAPRTPPRWRVGAGASGARCSSAVPSSAERRVEHAHRVAGARGPHDNRNDRSDRTEIDGGDRDVAITPDGSRIVYRGTNQMLVRALDQLEPAVLGGLGAPRVTFISPDGQWIGFFDGTTAQESGDHRRATCDVAPWTAILVAPRGDRTGPSSSRPTLRTGLQRVSAAGGEPAVLTKPDRRTAKAITSGRSSCLEAGRSSLRSPATGASTTRRSRCWTCGPTRRRCSCVAAATRTTCRRDIWSTAPRGRCAPCAFDLERLEATGTPAPVLEGVVTTPMGAADFAVAANGSLVYVAGLARAASAGTPSPQWIVRDVSRRYPASRRTYTATSGCRPMARGSPSPRVQTCGRMISPAPR